MDIAIALFISIFGSIMYGFDFCNLLTLVTITIELYKRYIKYTQDETARR